MQDPVLLSLVMALLALLLKTMKPRQRHLNSLTWMRGCTSGCKAGWPAWAPSTRAHSSSAFTPCHEYI